MDVIMHCQTLHDCKPYFQFQTISSKLPYLEVCLFSAMSSGK